MYLVFAILFMLLIMFGLFFFDNCFLDLMGTVFRFHLGILKSCSLWDLFFLNILVLYQPILRATATGNPRIKVFSALTFYLVNDRLVLGNIGDICFCEFLGSVKF